MFTKHKTSITLAACLLFTHNAYSMQDLSFKSNPLVRVAKIAGIALTLKATLSYGWGLLTNACYDTDYQKRKTELGTGKTLSWVLPAPTVAVQNDDGTVTVGTLGTEQIVLAPAPPKPTPLNRRVGSGAAGAMVMYAGVILSKEIWNFDMSKIIG